MKAELFLFSLLACCLAAFNSCSNDDDKFSPNKTVQNEFNTRYPNAKDVSWEWEDGYAVAKFRQGNEYSEAWFTEAALWTMTDTDLKFPSLPQDVQDTYNGSYYADWKIDEITRLERIDTKMTYIIEVEDELGAVDLLYSASGILINAIPHQSIEFYLPTVIPQKIKDFIAALYPEADIMQYSRFGYSYIVDIIVGVWPVHVAFDKNYDWQYTLWEEYFINLPQAIQDRVAAAYPGYRAVLSLHRETPSGTTYDLTLVSGKKTVQVVFDPEGNILSETSPAN